VTTLRTAPDVPFLDLLEDHRPLLDALEHEFGEVLRSSAFVNGPQVGAFESAFARYCGAAEAVGVASGLDALRLALASLDLAPGAEVIVPAMTFVATWEAVSQVGAVPVPVDVSETDYNLDVSAVESAITERTEAIVAVHLYGQMADMAALRVLAERRGLGLVEDAAQAHGALRAGSRAGRAGQVAAFSFYPGKNLGAAGDAGALVTDDAGVAARVRALREHGQYRKYEHDEIGWTARLDTIQAAVLLCKLPHLSHWNGQRGRVASSYLEALRGVGDLILPPVANDSEPVWHLFVVRTEDPVGLAEHLRGAGIATGRHYPEPPHLSRAYAGLGHTQGSFPVAESIARECLSLPIFPSMTEAQVLHVVESVKAWFVGD